MKQKHHHIAFVIIIIAIIAVFSLGLHEKISYEDVKDIVEESGTIAPLVFIILVVVQTIISIVPVALFIILGGVLFGAFLGITYSIIGVLLGCTAAFFIAKRFEKIIERFIEKKEIRHFEHIFKKRGIYAIIMFRAIPIIPNDVINFAAGASGMKYKKFFMITLLTTVPYIIIYNFFGFNIQRLLNFKSQILSVLFVLIFVIFLFRHKIKRLLIKEIKELEKR